jgi:sorbitol-6-phosphate 2-dehydrogenase
MGKFKEEESRNGHAADMKDRVAIVTGAGSGLGRSIGIGLAGVGAIAALLDIDAESLQQTVKIIEQQLPQSRTMAVSCDVTSEGGVDESFEAVLKKWGRLDILVNAAGIAPPGPLVDLEVEAWRQAVEVNLTGYFLTAKAAAKVMIKQGAGGSIINVSSKSGLEASRDNTAYNATKAGEIHMARGWAMELGEYGIRVNCVCPGNVFEGSKIWNPDISRSAPKSTA